MDTKVLKVISEGDAISQVRAEEVRRRAFWHFKTSQILLTCHGNKVSLLERILMSLWSCHLWGRI